jgi:hypothetical protein
MLCLASTMMQTKENVLNQVYERIYYREEIDNMTKAQRIELAKLIWSK